MDRHYLLSLLDKIQEKYAIQDGEYKEFAEAIGGKKLPIDLSNAKLVKVVYDRVESDTEFCDDEVYATLTITENCSIIWNVIPDENAYHTRDYISSKYLTNSDIHTSVIVKMSKDLSKNMFTMMSTDIHKRKYCIRVRSIEIVSTKP